MERMSTAAADQRPRRARRSGPRIALIVAIIVFLILAVAVWIGVRGLLAANDLRQALPAATRVQSAVTSGDASAASDDLAQLRTRADKAHSLTDDPVWWVVEKIPGIGPNLQALGGVAASAATVTDGDLSSVTKLAGEFSGSGLKPTNGAINVKPLAAAAPALAAANASVQAGAHAADAISTNGVIGPLASAVTQYRTKIDAVAKLTDAGSRAAALLPGMLGDNGPRTYLLLMLNNAELRATGGIAGSALEITADHGKLTFGKQSGAFGFGSPVLKLAAPTNELFGQITGEYLQDVTLTPHFDQSAELAREMWKRQFGQSVDGVVSIDPVALKYILQATGPVTMGEGTPFQTQLTSQNVVQTLLSTVYWRFSPSVQNDYFDVATNAVFAKVTSGDFSPSAMLNAFTEIGEQHRLNVWSSDASEEALLSQTTLAGTPAQSTPGEQRFGVYLADGTGAKMDYYLHTSVALGHLTCSPDGPLYVAEVTLKNGVAPSQVGSLPAYVSGDDQYGVPIGTIRTDVTVYGSPGMQFGNAFVANTGAAEPVKFVQDGKQSAAQYFVDLKPGESSTVRLIFNANKGQSGTAAVDVTPQINPVSIKAGDFNCGTVLK